MENVGKIIKRFFFNSPVIWESVLLFLCCVFVMWLYFDMHPAGFCVFVYFPWGLRKIILKDKEKKWIQSGVVFKDGIGFFKNSIMTGASPEKSIGWAACSLESLYGEDDVMTKAFKKADGRVHMGMSLEDAFSELAVDTGLEEAGYFAEMLIAVKRGGGNFKQLISDTVQIIKNRVVLRKEKKAAISSKMYEMRIMKSMPFLMVLYLRFCSAGMTQRLYSGTMGRMFMMLMLIVWVAIEELWELFLKDENLDKRRKYRVNGMAVVVVVCGLAMTVSGCVSTQSDAERTESAPGEIVVERNEAGHGEKNVKLHLYDENGGIDSYFDLKVKEKTMTAEEEDTFFADVEKDILMTMLGDNMSLAEVRSDLVLKQGIPEKKVKLLWKSSDPDIISSTGKVCPLTDETLTVFLQVKASFDDAFRVFEYEVRVLPPVLSESQRRENEVISAIRDIESDERSDIVIPGEISGVRIEEAELQKEPVYVPVLRILLIPIAICTLIYVFKSRKKEGYEKKKRKQLLNEYPEMISMFVCYNSAGYPMRVCFERVAAVYVEKKGDKHPLSVLLLKGMRELESGMPESLVYEGFGEATGLLPYKRFASIMVQNISKGMAYIQELLVRESEEAVSESRERISEDISELGTKLLFPMVMYMGQVIALIVIPAFKAI